MTVLGNRGGGYGGYMVQHMLRHLSIAVVVVGAIGSMYCVWAIHRVSANTLLTDSNWPRPWPYPDRYLAALNDWYDARYPAPPGSLKLRGELARVRLTVGAGLAMCLVSVVAGLAVRWACASANGSFLRRVLGIAICLAPAVLLLSSLSIGLAYSRKSWLALALATAGLLIAVLNFYLSFVAPLFYVWRRGSTPAMPYVSGVPVVGTALVVAAGIIGFPNWRLAVIGLVGLVLDTGGLPWFLFATRHDRSLWDRPYP